MNVENPYFADLIAEDNPEADSSLAKIIEENKALTEVSIVVNYAHRFLEDNCISTIAKALCANNTIEKLTIAEMYFGIRGADAFASVLRESTTLKEVQFLRFPDCVDQLLLEIFDILTSSLSHNGTLMKLHVQLPPSLLASAKIISACEKDSRLHCSSLC